MCVWGKISFALIAVVFSAVLIRRDWGIFAISMAIVAQQSLIIGSSCLGMRRLGNEPPTHTMHINDEPQTQSFLLFTEISDFILDVLERRNVLIHLS